MTVQLILPKTLPNLEPYDHLPLFSLRGPVVGAGDWQRTMTDLLISHVGDCVVVNPSPYTRDHPHHKYRLEGPHEFGCALAWRRHFSHEAAHGWQRGAIVCWFARESRESPRLDGLPYASNMHRELDELCAYLSETPDARIVVGGDPKSSDFSLIEEWFSKAAGREFTIHPTMEDVARHAAKYAKLPSRTDRVST